VLLFQLGCTVPAVTIVVKRASERAPRVECSAPGWQMAELVKITAVCTSWSSERECVAEAELELPRGGGQGQERLQQSLASPEIGWIFGQPALDGSVQSIVLQDEMPRH
jgi:hypothetical protein